MMHPEDLLAGHVDGALTEEERAALESHLAGCDRCRKELALATHGRGLLAGLPEQPVPDGFAQATLDEAARPEPAGPHEVTSRATAWPPMQAGAKRDRRPVQWLAGLAAAAAVVGIIAFAVLPQDDTTGGAGGGAALERVAGGPAAETSAPLKGLDVLILQPRSDFDATDLQVLADEVARGRQVPVPYVGAPAPAQPEGAEAKSPRAEVSTPGPEVSDCIRSAAQITERDRVVHAIEAKFDGTPAYIVVLGQSPTPEGAPGKAIVWVVSKSDCALLSYTQASG